MENFQRYFLIACVFIMSYFLIIRWDPPSTNSSLDIVVDEVIYRTPLGGFINHSDEPNCEKWKEDDKYFVKTIRHISKGEELFLKYTFYSIKRFDKF